MPPSIFSKNYISLFESSLSVVWRLLHWRTGQTYRYNSNILYSFLEFAFSQILFYLSIKTAHPSVFIS